ncbi:MAG TPA: alpha/beta fold hydrolase [Micromonosporaceae bacterium]
MAMPTLSARIRRAVSRRLAVSIVLAAVLLGAVGTALWPERDGFTVEERMLTVHSGPTGTDPVDLDTSLYLPDEASPAAPVPAVLLAHGFGGSKQSVRADAEELAGLGYAVLTYTARGFGRSGGQIHLNHPDHEVRDAQRLLDWLATRPEIRTDAAGDPRVGVVGSSYGGALALLLAAHDPRVDAIVPMITWNDLARALLPESSGQAPVKGVFKKAWGGYFFGSGGFAGPEAAFGPAGDEPDAEAGPSGPLSAPVPGAPGGQRFDPACGRFAADICAAYLEIATTGRATEAAVARLRRSSPADVLDRITAPTLLIQGTADTLFPLSEADANARGIAANGTPVRVAWFNGGHDGGEGPRTDRDRIKLLTAQWLDHHVKGAGSAPANSFTWSEIAGFDAQERGLLATGYHAADYPGLTGTDTRRVALLGPPQQIASPPNGSPAALSSLPMAGGISGLLEGVSSELPGQHAWFLSAPLDTPLTVVGAPQVSIRAASASGEAVLFVKLYDVDPAGRVTLVNGHVAPVRLADLPADVAEAQAVTVTLPAVVHRVEAGHHLGLVVATADQGYAGPVEPTRYTVALGANEVTVPTVTGEPIPSPAAVWTWVLAGLLTAVVLGTVVAVAMARRRQRRRDTAVHPGYADVPLVVRALRKEYADGFVAVANVDFEVRRGQVVGLLGPNGAGKTTTLRVLMGLTQPTAGEVYIFGHRLVPGSPVLSRIGALVEGPGFLPHLSGLENLRAYWRATGRPAADARFDEALEIAGLGESVHRKVRTYSHGMKQRLAIAQAMLGLPELLVLDEPTDGLDPPQIAEMRRVLKRYATGGRAVLVSSHLLAEVEQTCTHVVVVNKGRIVAAGPVEEIVGDSPTVQLAVSDVAAAQRVLDGLVGVRSLGGDGNGGLLVDVAGLPRAEVVAALVRSGIEVDRVVPRRRLEDAFLALVGEHTHGSGDR